MLEEEIGELSISELVADEPTRQILAIARMRTRVSLARKRQAETLG